MTSSHQTAFTTTDEFQSSMIDGLKFAMACLVVMIHVDGGLISSSYSGTYQGGLFDIIHILFAQGICRIAVPFFFMISGFLYFTHLREWNWHIYIKKEKRRVRTLVVPYLLWNIISIAVFIGVKYAEMMWNGKFFYLTNFIAQQGWWRIFWDCGRIIDESAVNVLGITMHNGFPFNGPLWFIRDLFIVTLFSPAVHFFIRKFGASFITLLSILMILNIWLPFEGMSSLAIFFFSLGGWIRLSNGNLINFWGRIKALSYTLPALLLTAAVICYGKFVLLYQIVIRLFAIFGCGTVVNLAADLHAWKGRLISPTLSKSSFFIFSAQRIFIIPLAVSIVSWIIPFEDNGIVSVFKYFASSTVCVLLCILLFLLLKKLSPKALTILSGRRL